MWFILHFRQSYNLETIYHCGIEVVNNKITKIFNKNIQDVVCV